MVLVCYVPTFRRLVFFCGWTHFALSETSSSSSMRKCGATLSGCLSRFCAWTPLARTRLCMFKSVCLCGFVADILFWHLGPHHQHNTLLFTSVCQPRRFTLFLLPFLCRPMWNVCANTIIVSVTNERVVMWQYRARVFTRCATLQPSNGILLGEWQRCGTAFLSYHEPKRGILTISNASTDVCTQTRSWIMAEAWDLFLVDLKIWKR